MTKLLKDALRKQKKQTKKEIPQITGILGIPLGGQRLVEVPNRNAFVYVRLRDNQNEVIQAFNNQVAPSYNLPVIVERQGNRYVVIGVDTMRYQSNWNSFTPYLPRHGNTHSFDPENGGGGDVVWVKSRQFAPIMPLPSGSLGATNILVDSYTIKNSDGTWRYVGNTGTPTITTYKPTMPTGAVIVLVYIDSDTGNPNLIVGSGSYFSAAITGSSQITPYIPSLTNPNYIPVAAVRLVTGTSVLTWDNIYDVRQWLHTTPTGTGGSSSITVQDEGASQGTATTFNFVGPSVDATVAGGVARIFITGTAGGISTGVFVQDEGIALGNVATLNFVGTNVDVSVSGSVARVHITGSMGGSTNLTGTAIGNPNRVVLTDSTGKLLTPDWLKWGTSSREFVEFGANIANKETNAGRMGYDIFNNGYFDMVGAGTGSNDRWVRILDNLKINSHLQTNSFQNLGLVSHFMYLNATGTFVAPDNAPEETFVTGSFYILGLNNSLSSVRFSATRLIGDVGIQQDGWMIRGETWTRTGNHTFTVPGDMTTVYRKGTKVRYNEGGGSEYGVVGSSSHSAGTTTITLITNTDYAMGSNPSVRHISYIDNPEGFPAWFNITSPTVTGESSMTWSTTSTIHAAWRPAGGANIEVSLFLIGTVGGTPAKKFFISPVIAVVSPFTAAKLGVTQVRDGSSGSSVVGSGFIDTSNGITVYKQDDTNWTTGASRVLFWNGIYPY